MKLERILDEKGELKSKYNVKGERSLKHKLREDLCLKSYKNSETKVDEYYLESDEDTEQMVINTKEYVNDQIETKLKQIRIIQGFNQFY